MGKRIGFITLWLYMAVVLHVNSDRGGLHDGYTSYKGNWDSDHIPVKKVKNNYSVPYSVPVLRISSPRLVKVFKTLSIGHPTEKPHIVNKVQRVSFGIPALKFLPIRATVPVPQIAPTPIPIRLAKPVMVTQTKTYNLHNKIPVPVPVKITGPVFIPIVKKIPVPVPHPVKNTVNVVREVPVFNKKLYPVYIEDKPWHEYGGNSASSELSGHFSASPNSHGSHVGEYLKTTGGMRGYQGRNYIANGKADGFQQRSYVELGGKSISLTTGYSIPQSANLG